MTARTHDVAAVTALGIVLLAQPIGQVTLATALVALVANQLGGIAPDIDQPTAPLWRNLPVGRVFGKVFGVLAGGHRFLSHSLIGVALFGLLAHWLLQAVQPIIPTVNTPLVWWAFMIGIVSHLAMDMLTREGVPLLLPIPVKFGLPPIKRLRVVTGSWRETLVILPLLVVGDAWLCVTHYDTIMAFLQHGLLR